MHKLKLLIVDDTPANIISLEYLLNDYFEDIEILTANNGEEALKIAFDNEINLIILDIQMPVMDGFETATYLKKSSKTKEIPIIFLTAAFKEDEFQKKGFETGAVDYLTKPIDNHQFINKLRLYIELFKKNKQLEVKQKEQDTLLSFFDKGDAVLLKWENTSERKIVYISQSIEKLLGYTKKEIFDNGIDFDKCIHPEDLQKVLKEFEDNNKDYFKHEQYRVITKSGEVKWVNNYTALQKDENANVSHYIEYITDITEDKNKEKLMFEQTKLASMGEMIGNIAHQWRQPLSVISTAATGMKLQKEFDALEDEQLIKTCDMINANTQYLSKTIDDFRDFIKDEKVEKEFEIKENIENFIHLVDPNIHMYNIEMVLDIKENVKLRGYPNELKQCFINLFNNSKDAFKINNVDDRFMFLSVQKENNKVLITLKDNAGGIPDDTITKIFEPYFTTKHQSQGTGLGLHMVNNIIVNGMGGAIDVKNETFEYKGKNYTGASFTITLNI